MRKTLIFRGVEYHLPYAELFPPLSPDKKRELHDSIKAIGVIEEVLTYDSKEYGPNSVIDGINRLEIGGQLGVNVPIRKLSLTDDAARRRAEDLNSARRQVSAAEAKAARQKRVHSDRAAGMTLQAIADKEQISKVQVTRDLDEVSCSLPGTTDPDSRVTGRDGKSYPAQKPKKNRRKKAQQSAGAEPVHPYLELRQRVIALTQEINAAINAEGDDAVRLRVLLCAAGAVLFSNAEKRYEFQPLLGIPLLLGMAADGGTLPNEANIKLKYLEAAGAWVSPAVAAIRADKAKKRRSGT